MPKDIDDPFELGSSFTAARALLGAHLVRHLDGCLRRARIVETEAYWEDDPASHSYAGVTERTRVMFGRPGRAYVYRIHRVVCLNVVAGPVGRGEAVLLRAVEPLAGIEAMESARASRTVGQRVPRGVALTNGPGKLCQALDVTIDFYGADLLARESKANPPNGTGPGADRGSDVGSAIGSLWLEARPLEDEFEITLSPRIGISKARDEPMRFFIAGNRWVSRG